jgi:tetratricopeptide (TPR) repeat protein
LLPGPSLLDLVTPRESPLVSADLTTIEWESPRTEPTPADAVRLVRLLGLNGPTHPVLSVGDADLLHRFLRDTRRSTPTSPDERAALADVSRYLASCDWMPSHLAAEYRLRADTLVPRLEVSASSERPAVSPVVETIPSPPLPESFPEEPEFEPLEDLPSMDLEPAEDPGPLPGPDPFRPEPVPEPEPPLPLPEPPAPQPQPEPEPEPEEARKDEARWTEFEAMKNRLETERAQLEAQAHSRVEELRARETSLVERERTLASKEKEIEVQAQAVTDRLVALEKDTARRDVLRFLGTVPGMSESQADVVASAFPDMTSLQSADVKALTQCKGVTDALARAIRYELVPGEVDDEQRATRLREEAQAFVEEGLYEAALACYDRLLQDRPRDLDLLFDRAELLVLLDRKEDALRGYAQIVEVDAANRRAWYERANLLFGLDRLPEAVDALKESLRIDPTKTGDIVSKAEQLRRDGHPSEAVALFQAILDVNPAETRAVLGLGDALLGLGDSEGAEALFSQALGKNPQNATIVFRKGELLERKGRWGAAIQYYNRAIALKWNFVSPWLSKAKILIDHGRASEALECFDKVASFDPEDVEAWAGKARAHGVLGDREAAAAALQQAERLDPGHPSVIAARAAIGSIPRPEPEAPAESIDEPAEEPPSEAASDFHSLVKAFEAIEEEPEPRPGAPPTDADFQSFVESIEPENEETQVLLQLAELALEGGDAAMALLRYDQALAKDDRNADAWTGKGVSLQQLERYREALEAYNRALSLQPDHALAKKWRATCLRHIESEASG